MVLNAENMHTKVNEIFEDVFIEDGPDEDKVTVRGLTAIFAFSKKKLESHRGEVKELLDMLSPNFKMSVGGGWSFMKMPFTLYDEQWGEQPAAQKLLVVAIGLRMMAYLTKPDLWIIFPGSVPYVCIIDKESEGLYYGD